MLGCKYVFTIVIDKLQYIYNLHILVIDSNHFDEGGKMDTS